MSDTPLSLSAPPHLVRPLAELDDDSAAEAQSAARCLLSVAERIETSLFTPRSIHCELRDVRAYINRIKGQLSDRGISLVLPTAEESRATLGRTLDCAVLRLKLDADLWTALDRFARFDEYFGTRRIDELDPQRFLLQLLVTTDFVLRDLSSCMVDRHEILMILRGVAAGMTRTTDSEMPSGARGDVTGDRALEDDISAEQTRSLSLSRWKVGHHLFNELATMSLHLIEATIASGNSEEKASSIVRLCRTYRAMTAAMWYAQAFPPRMYTELIRPSMEIASSGGSGFSGTDNLDFRIMKYRLREMLGGLEKDIGTAETCQEHLWQVVCYLYDVQLLDLEHHVLIAEKLVGSSPSLKQVRLAESSDGHADLTALSGVDALRGMVAERTHAKAMFLTGEGGS
ncbi:MAG: hypothetical protein ACRDSH_05035 [Pseudonocardiaceae bacterium]